MFTRRVQVIAVIFGMGFLILLGRLYQIQILSGHVFEQRGEARIHRLEQIAPRRGPILDRNGVILAEDTATCNIAFIPWPRSKSHTPPPLGRITPEQVAALETFQGAQLDFERGVLLDGILRDSPLLPRLSKLLMRPGPELAESMLVAALDAATDSAPGAIHQPRLLTKDIGTKAYLHILSLRDMEGEKSPLASLAPQLGWRRVYPEGAVFSHIVGYVGHLTARQYEILRGYWTADGAVPGQGELPGFFVPSETEMSIIRLREFQRSGKNVRASGHLMNATIGRSGIEMVYNDELRGRHGLRHLRLTREDKSALRVMKVVGVEDSGDSGHTIQLTMDAEFQRDVHAIMIEEIAKLERERQRSFDAACVMMDPQTGEIQAMVSLPDFDPETINEHFAEYLKPESRQPLISRVFQEQFPPGSTFKPIASVKALTDQIITEETTFFCDGSMPLGRATFRCLGHHGDTNVVNALRVSCNLFYYQLGKKMGGRGLFEAAEEVGYGTRTGLDLPGEARGHLPQNARTGVRWSTGATLNFSIGQGDFSVTPMQVAVAIAAIANGGGIVRPHVRQDATLTGPVEWVRMDPEALRIVRQGMWAVVNENGTGRRARLDEIVVAGKSGSAEWRKREPAHAWFAFYAPFDDPKTVGVVIVPSGNYGGTTCAPIAKRLLERFFELNPEVRGVG